MFERLFKFDAISFSEGAIGWQVGHAVYVFAFLAVLLVAGFVVVYTFTRIYTSDRAKATSLGLRIPALLLLCLPLFEPVLIRPDVVPDENFVAVLVDVSQSMTLPDGAFGSTRAADVQHVLFDEDDGIVRGIDEPFKVRYYTFGDRAERTDSVRAMRAEGQGTNLSAALDRVLNDFKGLPLAGVVLLTDGGDNSTDVPLNKAEELRARDVPLHVVGVGREAFDEERELLEVAVSKGVEETTGAEIDVKARSWAEERRPVTFNVLKDGEVVHTETQLLKGEGKVDQFTIFYEPDQEGAAEYEVAVAPAAGEINTTNNSLPALIDARRDTVRVLFFEGHLRQEFKFVKRALEDDQVIDFTSISRTGTGKFYRQGIKTPDELEGGFPDSPEVLNQFKAVIFGDVEASVFSIEQLQMIENFVRVRGGGFLMVGGRGSFAESAYWNGPIANVLPVELDPGRRQVLPRAFVDPDDPDDEQGFAFAPTAVGLESPILKLSSDPATNRTRWSTMPGLTSINYLGAVKPAAVVLAEKPEDDFGPSEPLLVTQRYGKGRSAALATASTWRWQMRLPADDARHERFWRQLARWLIASAPDAVNVDVGSETTAPGEEMTLSAQVYDERFFPREGATVRAVLTDPLGAQHEVAFQPELTEPGLYTAAYVPQHQGVYALDVAAETADGPAGSAQKHFLVRPSNREFYDATMKRPLLRHLAEAAGGQYYDVADAGAIPTNLRGRRTSTSIYHADYLWDMPLLFGLVLVLLSAEWVYRRRKGLP